MTRETEHSPQPAEDDRRILTRRKITVFERGGIAYQTISLPRISMHVAALAAAKARQERAHG